jgi:hypothetical protein
VDGKTLRGSRTRDTTARHVLAAADRDTGVVLASTDVDTKTNEITRFADLLDQINDLRDVVVTADALHCQRDHVTYLAQRGAHWILTVKGNQPGLHRQLAGLPWRLVPDAGRGAEPDALAGARLRDARTGARCHRARRASRRTVGSAARAGLKTTKARRRTPCHY